MLSRYRPVLAVPGSLRLYSTGVVARLPQGMSELASLLLVRTTTHSYAVAGLAAGAEALSAAAIGPLQGRLVDRFGRVWVLGPWGLTQAALFVALVVAAHVHAPGAVLVLTAAAIGAAQPAFAPTVRALLRSLLTDRDLRESAYALEAVIQEVIWITGPLVVAAVITAGSDALAVLVCAGTTVVGTLLFISSPLARVHERRGDHVRRAILREIPELRGMLVPVALMGCAIGSTSVGLPSLALHVGSRSSTGLLMATWSLGSMIGGLFYGSRQWNTPLAGRYRRLLGAAVLCGMPLVFAHSIAFGLVAALLTGLTIAPVFSCQYALIGGAVPEGSETEAFTWVMSALVVGIAVGNAVGGVLIDGLGVSGPFLLSCTALAIGATTAVGARRLSAVAQ